MRVIFAMLLICASSVAAYADTNMDPEGQERYRTMPPPPIPPPPPPPEPVFERISPDPPIISRPAPPERRARQAPRKTVRRPPQKKRADPCEARCASALEAKDKRIAELENELKALRDQTPSGQNPFFPPGNSSSGAAPPPPPSDCCEKVSQLSSSVERALGQDVDLWNRIWWIQLIGGIAFAVLLILALVAISKKR